CEALNNIYLPYGVAKIGEYAFYGCKNLLCVKFDRGLDAIEDAAFFGCTALHRIYICKGLLSIGKSAFSGCKSLKVVYFLGMKNEWDEIVVDEDNDRLEAARIITLDRLKDE
ncbi:MAG: leucine-rich repeat domain-containing protein, partial [Bacteroidales bacterium]|nr:leucine-rich repeat domain-containing protein [Bacteroidales bacterium]